MTLTFAKLSAALVLVAVCIAGCANKKAGDACETYRSEECGGPGGTCLGNNAGNYCSITCGSAKECPSGWKCGGVTSTTINGKGEKKGEQVVNMCLRP